MTFRFSRLASACAMLLAAHSAAAEPTTYLLSYLGGDPDTARGPGAENLTVFAPGMLPGGLPGPVGPVWLTVSGSDGSLTTVQVYSTDLRSTLCLPGPYLIEDLSGSTGDPVKDAQVVALMTNGQLVVHDAASAAALQAAIWEVEYEAGSSGYNVQTGAFQISSYGGFIDHATPDDAARFLANVEDGTWETNSGMDAWRFVSLAGSGPSFGFAVPGARTTLDTQPEDDSQTILGQLIPEPAALAVLAGGMVLLVLWTRRRER
jgi:hypothetical protein